MNRRTFLSAPLKPVPRPPEGEKDEVIPVNPFANKELPKTERSTAGLAPYTGPWGREQASHLLRRTMFGPTHSEISQAISDGLSNTLDSLFAWDSSQPLPSPPLNYANQNDPGVPIGSTWVDAFFWPGTNGYRSNSLVSWTMGHLLNQSVSLREKMTLFWHNHFVIEAGVVNDPRFLYRYISLLRTNCLGNFKDLVKDITIDPGMLQYLNGNQNVAASPNENYARELFELFTIGKGEQIAPGNYTNYTEQDVAAAAKVLTGWRDRGNFSETVPIGVEFRPNRHDTSTKQFSTAFGNQTIADNGMDEYKDLVDMIFTQDEVARFICRKLYRWFVYYVIDENVETDVIEPMAQLMIASNYEIEPALRALLNSEHFYDHLNMGPMIKNPIDFMVSIVRQLELKYPDDTQLEAQYLQWLTLYFGITLLSMPYFSPPSVAGWSAYYQIPQFYQQWINSVTLPYRSDIISLFLFAGVTQKGFTVIATPLELIPFVSTPDDPNVLIEELSQLFLPQPLTTKQKDFLKEVLIPGLPDFEWTLEYNAYLSDPMNAQLAASVDLKLRLMFNTMFKLAEYHLS